MVLSHFLVKWLRMACVYCMCLYRGSSLMHSSFRFFLSLPPSQLFLSSSLFHFLSLSGSFAFSHTTHTLTTHTCTHAPHMYTRIPKRCFVVIIYISLYLFVCALHPNMSMQVCTSQADRWRCIYMYAQTRSNIDSTYTNTDRHRQTQTDTDRHTDTRTRSMLMDLMIPWKQWTKTYVQKSALGMFAFLVFILRL